MTASESSLPGDSPLCGLEHLQSDILIYDKTIPSPLLHVLSTISRSVVDIGIGLRNVTGGYDSEKTSTQNTFGDEQLNVDVKADEAVFSRLKKMCSSVSPDAPAVVAVAASEETTKETEICSSISEAIKAISTSDSDNKVFSVAFDPLDGSSIVDANFTVGSIFGIWPGQKLLGRKGRDQVGAVLAMYGPRITMAVGVKVGEVLHAFELTLVQQFKWVISRPKLSISPSPPIPGSGKGAVFAPGNLRASNDSKEYDRLLKDFYLKDRYTLRYTGGMVPDVYHMFIKGKGVFLNVSSEKAKAKLRLLYELAPVAFVVECCGGKSSSEKLKLDNGDGSGGISILDLVVEDLDQRGGGCFGGIGEVDLYEKIMLLGG